MGRSMRRTNQGFVSVLWPDLERGARGVRGSDHEPCPTVVDLPMAPIFSASFAVSAFKICRLVLHRSVVRVVTDAQQPPGILGCPTFRIIEAVFPPPDALP